MKRGQTVDESHNDLGEKHHLLAQPSGKRSTLREKHAHPCGEVPEMDVSISGKNTPHLGYHQRKL
jgi:hypothetical protein